jgi:hypothetical protein
LYLIPSLLVIVYIWSSYHLGQPHLVLLALMLGSFVALRAKREIVAGPLIAIAAAIKAFPVLPSFIWFIGAFGSRRPAFSRRLYFCFSFCRRRSGDLNAHGTTSRSGALEC